LSSIIACRARRCESAHVRHRHQGQDPQAWFHLHRDSFRCFARKSHTYLDLDYGRDFDTRIVVKVNAPELLRKELAQPKWAGEHIAMGTATDTTGLAA